MFTIGTLLSAMVQLIDLRKNVAVVVVVVVVVVAVVVLVRVVLLFFFLFLLLAGRIPIEQQMTTSMNTGNNLYTSITSQSLLLVAVK